MRTLGGGGGEGVHWVHVHPRTCKKVPVRNIQKRKKSTVQICRQKRLMHVPLRYDKIKTKKVWRKEGKCKRKGIKEIKKEDSPLSEIEIIK